MNKAINCLFGHTNDVLDMSYMSNSSSLLFTVGDTQCCLWNTFNPQGTPICSLEQHSWSYEVRKDKIFLRVFMEVRECFVNP